MTRNLKMKKHQKHSNITKRNNGNYAPNEISILGVKCSIISDLVRDIAKTNQKIAKIVYLDASHNKEKSNVIVEIKDGKISHIEIAALHCG